MSERLLITGGTVITLGQASRFIEDGAVLISDGVIEAVGTAAALKKQAKGSQVISAKGKVVMPGFINAHMHLYSTFARGIMPKQPPAKTFVEVLERLWFPLDNALNAKDLKYSALIPYIDCIRNGTTTIIDHHESQSFQLGSLDVLEKAARQTGIRSVFCLGSSDRYGRGEEGVEENIRFIRKIQARNRKGDDLVAALFGLHALFTVNQKTLKASARAASELGVGFHVHVAEAASDQEFNVKKFKRTPVERMADAGALGEKTLAIHGVHISESDMKLLAKTGTALVHNPQSNQNNAVGIAPVKRMQDLGMLVGLGTDGMTSNMREEVRVATIAQRLKLQDPSAFFVESCMLLLQNNARIAGRYFQKPVGVLEPGAYGDVIVLDYTAPTPFNENTFLGHFLFGLCGADVLTTIVNGRVLMENRVIQGLPVERIMGESRKQCQDFWSRF